MLRDIVHTARYTAASLLREKDIIIWVLLFPLILSTLFQVMFSGIENNAAAAITPISVAIVDKSGGTQAGAGAKDDAEAFSFRSVVARLSQARDGSEALLAPVEADADTARALVAEGKAAGIVTVAADGTPSLAVGPVEDNDIALAWAQTALADLVSSYARSRAALEAIAQDDPQALAPPSPVLDALSTRESFIRPVSLTHATANPFVRYYYALLGFASFMAANVSLTAMIGLLPAASPLGARRWASGTGRGRQIAGTLAASWLLGFLALAAAFVFIRVVLGIEFGGREGLCLAGIAVASLMSVFIGSAIAALPRIPTNAKSGILTAITCFLALFAGLYGTPAMHLADSVAESAPWLAAANPVKQVADMFYALYVYTDLAPFLRSLVLVAASGALAALATAFLARRPGHARL